MATKRSLKQTSPDNNSFGSPKRLSIPSSSPTTTKMNNAETEAAFWSTFDAKINAVLDIKLQKIAKKDDVLSLSEELRKVRSENEMLRTRLSFLERQIERIDKNNRRCNVIVGGLPGASTEIVGKNFSDLATKTLKTNISISNAAELPNGSFIFTLISASQASSIFKQRKLLKGTSIYLQKDFTAQENSNRKYLRQLAKSLKGIRGVKVKMGDYSIFINDRAFSWRDGQITADSKADADMLSGILHSSNQNIKIQIKPRPKKGNDRKSARTAPTENAPATTANSYVE